MKKIGKIWTIILSIALICLSVVTNVGCKEKKADFPKTENISGLSQIQEKGYLKFEWLGTFIPKRPTIIMFHGEQNEDAGFNINLLKTVYIDEVLYEDVNNKNVPLGWKAEGFKDADGGKTYWMGDYWLDAAAFNVAVFHCERFFAENAEDCVTKIYSDYKMRYIEDGKAVSCDFGMSLAQVVAVMYIEEMTKVGANPVETRFLGTGVGADLATAVTYYLYKSYDEEAIAGDYLPYRLTLCDPYLNPQKAHFSLSFDKSIPQENGVLGMMYDMIGTISSRSTAVEMVESREVKGKEEYAYAYTYAENNQELKDKLIKQTAYLLLDESYSLNPSFDDYKAQKRIAFDWYVYSVIGSDDSEGAKADYETLSVGVPHTLEEYRNLVLVSYINWGTNARRPILNNRRAVNDTNEGIGAYRGINFGIGAWTPTPYIKALKGMRFEQKEAEYSGKISVFGAREYEYKPYVLKVFRSENFQVSDRTDYTVVTGRVYFDEDENASMDDGAERGMESKMFFSFSLDNTEEDEYIVKNTITTDANGYFYIALYDAKENGEKHTFSGEKGAYTITGIDLSDERSYTMEFDFICPKGVTVAREPTGSEFFVSVNKHNFSANGTCSVHVDSYTVHQVLVRNCLPKAVEK